MLVGKERALLIDTGYGAHDLAACVRKLTSLPVTVVNTHLHPDHSGGNRAFGAAMVGEADLPAHGIYSNALAQTVLPAFCKSHPVFAPAAKYFAKTMHTDVEGVNYSALPEKIDLGGRTVAVHPCAGHTAGSVLFVDDATRFMFAGDAVNNELWLFTCPASTAAGYAETLRALLPVFDGCDKIYIAHSGKPLPDGFVRAFIAALDAVSASECKRLNFVAGTPEPLTLFRRRDPRFGDFRVVLWLSQASEN